MPLGSSSLNRRSRAYLVPGFVLIPFCRVSEGLGLKSLVTFVLVCACVALWSRGYGQTEEYHL